MAAFSPTVGGIFPISRPFISPSSHNCISGTFLLLSLSEDTSSRKIDNCFAPFLQRFRCCMGSSFSSVSCHWGLCLDSCRDGVCSGGGSGGIQSRSFVLRRVSGRLIGERLGSQGVRRPVPRFGKAGGLHPQPGKNHGRASGEIPKYACG